MTKQLTELIRRAGILRLALAFALGAQLSDLASSLIRDAVVPFAESLAGATDFRFAIVRVGTARIRVGSLAITAGTFVAVAAFVAAVAAAGNRLADRRGAGAAREPRCPYCLETVNPGAVRCGHCTSNLAAA